MRNFSKAVDSSQVVFYRANNTDDFFACHRWLMDSMETTIDSLNSSEEAVIKAFSEWSWNIDRESEEHHAIPSQDGTSLAAFSSPVYVYLNLNTGRIASIVAVTSNRTVPYRGIFCASGSRVDMQVTSLQGSF